MMNNHGYTEQDRISSIELAMKNGHSNIVDFLENFREIITKDDTIETDNDDFEDCLEKINIQNDHSSLDSDNSTLTPDRRSLDSNATITPESFEKNKNKSEDGILLFLNFDQVSEKFREIITNDHTFYCLFTLGIAFTIWLILPKTF